MLRFQIVDDDRPGVAVVDLEAPRRSGGLVVVDRCPDLGSAMDACDRRNGRPEPEG